jgi:hypothetical protein
VATRPGGALLEIAALVRVDGRLVSAEAVAQARMAGATDREIHDTVLITATFCMFNRYVDGLATSVPDDPVQYAMSAAHLVRHTLVAVISVGAPSLPRTCGSRSPARS